MPPGKKAASKTPMADYDDGCRVTSISTSSPITTSRRSSSPLISRPANASASRHRSRPSTPNLEKTSKSVSLDPVALHPGIHDQLRAHLVDFVTAYNFARRLKILKGLSPYEYICSTWTKESGRFILNPIHQMPGLNT